MGDHFGPHPFQLLVPQKNKGVGKLPTPYFVFIEVSILPPSKTSPISNCSNMYCTVMQATAKTITLI